MSTAAETTRPRVALTTALCFLVAVLEGYDLQIMSAIGPLLRGALHLDHQKLGIIFSASLIGLAFGATLGGYVADRLGRKPVIVISVLALGLFTISNAFAIDYPSLFLGRVLTGLAIGGAMPNTIVAVESVADRRRSASLVTLMICGVPTGGIVAALASHSLADHLGWRGLFVFGGVLTLLVAPAIHFFLPVQKMEPRQERVRPSLANALFGGERAPATAALWMLSVLSLGMVSLLAGWLPTLVVDKGLPPSAGFSTLLAWNVGGVFGVVMVGRVCDSRLGIRNTLVLTYLAMAAVLVVFAAGTSATTLIAFAAVVNIFVAGSHYTLYSVSPRLYPEEGQATGVGAALAAGRIGSVLGPVVAGLFLGAGSRASQVIMGLVPVALVCAVLVVILCNASGGKFGRREARPDGAALAVADT